MFNLHEIILITSDKCVDRKNILTCWKAEADFPRIYLWKHTVVIIYFPSNDKNIFCMRIVIYL